MSCYYYYYDSSNNIVKVSTIVVFTRITILFLFLLFDYKSQKDARDWVYKWSRALIITALL